MASMLLHYFKRGEKTQNTVILIFRSSNCVLSIVDFCDGRAEGVGGGGSPKIKGLRKRHAALHFENVHHPLGFLPIGLYL